jgi:DNA-binding CsgD family transcriptional regulator
MERVVRALRDAESLVSVARAVFDEGVRALGATGAVIELYTQAGAPIVCLSDPPVAEEVVRAYMRAGHRDDPCLGALRTTWNPVASLDVDADSDELVGPIIGDGALLGALRFAIVRPPTSPLRRALGALSTHVSVRLAELGFAAPLTAAYARLTRRQREVVHLTTRGLTTQQMATVLAISPNTVKKHLRLVFAQLGVRGRVELATHVSRFAARIDRLDELRATGVSVVWSEPEEPEPEPGPGPEPPQTVVSDDSPRRPAPPGNSGRHAPWP